MLEQALLYDFELAGRRLLLWKRQGESYEHVLMKALGYAMFVGEFPGLEVERTVGLRYKPDLVARDASDGSLLFWGECGANSLRKTAWILKHTRVERFVLFKIGRNVGPLVESLREEVPARYRPGGRALLVNFAPEVVGHTLDRKVEHVPAGWYTRVAL